MQTMVMVMRADRPEHTPESEGLLIDTDTPGVLRLVLDDGVEIVALCSAFAEAGIEIVVPRIHMEVS